MEAIIRITESLAKLRLSPVATEEHVEEAIRLFTASTMDAVDQGLGSSNDVTLNAEIKKVEQELRRRLPIGWSTAYKTLRKEFVDSGKASASALESSIYNGKTRSDQIQTPETERFESWCLNWSPFLFISFYIWLFYFSFYVIL